MNKTVLFSLVLLLGLSFEGCKKAPLLYSCDPAINNYVFKNLELLSSYTLTDIAQQPLLIQQAIFRSFTPEKKREIWLEKIQYLVDHESYSDLEYLHILKLREHLTTDYFVGENLQNNEDSRFNYSMEWITYARQTLGWSEYYVAFVVYRLYCSYDQLMIEINLAKTSPSSTSGGTTGNPCGCSVSENFCVGSACIYGNCKQVTGCGWLWGSTCDGLCNQ